MTIAKKLQITKKYEGTLPEHVTFKWTNFVSGKSKLTLSYTGDKINKKAATEIIYNLCVMIYTPQKYKGCGQFIDKKDVFFIIAELIKNTSISFNDAKKACLLFCSNDVFLFNMKKYTSV